MNADRESRVVLICRKFVGADHGIRAACAEVGPYRQRSAIHGNREAGLGNRAKAVDHGSPVARRGNRAKGLGHESRSAGRRTRAKVTDRGHRAEQHDEFRVATVAPGYHASPVDDQNDDRTARSPHTKPS